MSVAPAEIDDASSILELQRAAYQSEAALYEDWTIPPLVETLEELRADMGRCRFLKLTIGGTLVGSVRARRRGTTVSVERLIVAPERQGEGFGRTLLRAAEETFVGVERSELFTGEKSERNLRLYERFGYRPFRRQVLSPRVTLVFLEKPLAG
jgi:GNAT superfamily N-acetyltransferase